MRIAFWGNFGTGNLGNECTLQAMIHNVRGRLPVAELACICTEPEDAAVRHGIRAFPIDPARHHRRGACATRRPRAVRRVARLVREARGFLEAIRIMRRTDMLVMTGTGMLTDTGEGPLGLTYQILKWALAARWCRTRLLFVSVGVGGIAHPFSKLSVKAALRLAAYRSYRDAHSRESLARLGFASRTDPLYPDLAFSLPPLATDLCDGPGWRRPRLAVGLYDHGCVPRALRGPKQRAYLGKLREFILWALDGGYEVRVVIGDIRYDLDARRALVAGLEAQGVAGSVASEPPRSVEELIAQLAGVDVVVATRFHTVLLGLMLGKPVVSVSYEAKNDELMAAMGLGEYCQRLDELDVGRLADQVRAARRAAASIGAAALAKSAAFRGELAEQYGRILGGAA